MARLKTKGGKSNKRAGSRVDRSRDAISLLKADHREVEGWFADFEKAYSGAKKSGLARKICEALRIHTTIEEEIFYPAFLEATEDKDTHHEAEVEHEGAKKLIAEIESSDPSDDYYDAKVTVLSEMIKHHVKEEEQSGGMFAKAKKSDLDLEVLGEQLAERKAELMSEVSSGDTERLQARSDGRAGRETIARSSRAMPHRA
jgi:hemerythrin HHE cation binding domain-containing protein